MDVSKVTDCARISLEFATAEGLERAATFVLQAASTFKNRVANPTDEGYRDLMFTVLIGGHVCEVFAAPAPPPVALPPCSAPAPLCMGWGAGRVSGERGGSLALAARVWWLWLGVCGSPFAALTRCHVRRRRRSSCTWWR